MDMKKKDKFAKKSNLNDKKQQLRSTQELIKVVDKVDLLAVYRAETDTSGKLKFSEPDPNDPEFVNLCTKLESAGVVISNNPALGDKCEYLPLSSSCIQQNPLISNNTSRQTPNPEIYIKSGKDIFESFSSNETNEGIEVKREKEDDVDITQELPKQLRTTEINDDATTISSNHDDNTSVAGVHEIEDNVMDKDTGEDEEEEDGEPGPETAREKSKRIREMIKQMDISDENRERIKSLINQVADLRVDESIIDKGMEETFDMRREWISSKVPAIRTIYEVFPAFILEEILISEFKRIKGFTKFSYPTFLEKLKLKLKKITTERITSELQNKYSSCKLAMDALGSTSLAETSEKYEALVYSVGMCILWHQKVSDVDEDSLIRYEKMEPNVTEDEAAEKISEKRLKIPLEPYIIVLEDQLIDATTGDSRMLIYIENNEVEICNNFYRTMVMVYLLYWVLNLEYQPNVRGLFEYFDLMITNMYLSEIMKPKPGQRKRKKRTNNVKPRPRRRRPDNDFLV